ncbi:hypothetical protein FOL47_007202 [Perkinsus chesapeaki]|uniref:DUF4371 domain-containing protein n=1 Tax=Perkinsus chesapeaki TaxID=330153 RepID=A0A7J6LM59_PERCH|nr:hypothetical protein FOL47_007202 [Perkinsus chesapeaki]
MKKRGQSVATLINTQNQDVVKQNRHYLRSILFCIFFRCKQGLALRGHREALSNVADGDNPGNFLELTRLLSRFDDVVKQRLSDGPGNARYTHHSIQNDLIACAAKLVRQSVASEVAACGAFSLICDEARDIAHTERLSLCVRYVYDAHCASRRSKKSSSPLFGAKNWMPPALQMRFSAPLARSVYILLSWLASVTTERASIVNPVFKKSQQDSKRHNAVSIGSQN